MTKQHLNSKKIGDLHCLAKKGFLKIVVLSLIIGLNWSAISAIGKTRASFQDIELSEENTFTAGTLDFHLDSSSEFLPKATQSQPANRDINVIKDGTLNYRYIVEAVDFDGGLCDVLNLQADFEGEMKYQGALKDFILDPFVENSGDEDGWHFSAILISADSNYYNKTCRFNFKFKGWQTDLAEPVNGFNDEEIISNTITSGSWIIPQPPGAGSVVINEFLPNPIGDDRTKMPDGEWVELYNTGNTDADVFGWFIYDNDDNNEIEIVPARTNTHDTIVPAGGFLVVYRHNDPDFALNNTGGDSVRLYSARISHNGALIDSYSYAIDAPENKSFARIPDGSDNWYDPFPTPGRPNILEEERAEEIVEEEVLTEPAEEIVPGVVSKEPPLIEENQQPQENILEENQEGGIMNQGENFVDEESQPTTTSTDLLSEPVINDNNDDEGAVTIVEEINLSTLGDKESSSNEEVPSTEILTSEDQPIILPDNSCSPPEGSGGSEGEEL